MGTDDDYVIYIDTDSIFVSLFHWLRRDFQIKNLVCDVERIMEVCGEVQNLNVSYDYFINNF